MREDKNAMSLFVLPRGRVVKRDPTGVDFHREAEASLQPKVLQ